MHAEPPRSRDQPNAGRDRQASSARVLSGRASTVVDRGDGTVLRTGGDPTREARVMEVAASHGFPVPRVHDVLADGLVLERIEGPLQSEVLRTRPLELRRQMRLIAELHERLHDIPYDGAALVHFDLHPNNVIVSPRGPVVIDWTNAHGGEPDSDVAMSWLIFHTSAGWRGRIAAWMFRGIVGDEPIRRGLARAAEFRVADPAVTDHEKALARRALARWRAMPR